MYARTVMVAYVPRVLGALLVASLAIACAGVTDDGSASGDDQNATGAKLRAVDITVSAKKTGEIYEGRAYPIDDVDGDGRTELYKAPVYYVYLDGTDANGAKVHKEYRAPRFMPYNNPAGARHDNDYKTTGFVTAGLSSVPRFAVGTYKPDYEVHNRFSPFGGAIVVKGSFYIHAGPETIDDAGWGSAGCVEIIGNFDAFKKDILTLAGSPAAAGDSAALHQGVGALVAARRLFVTYENAARPNLQSLLSRQISGAEAPALGADLPTDPTDPAE